MPWFTFEQTQIYFEESGSGDPVLVLPGFSDSVGGHAVLREALSRNYRVIAADLPGSGRSGPQPRVYHADYYEEDARAFVAFLQQMDAVPSHLLGYSDGGEVALLMAAIAPEVARSVLTWGAQGFIPDTVGQIIGVFRRVIDDPIPEHQVYRTYLIDAYGEDIARAMTQSFADAIDAISARGGDISLGRAGQIQCATLLLVGQHDQFCSQPLVNDLVSRMRNASAVEVEGAGHGVHEDRPEWFATTVSGWLARV